MDYVNYHLVDYVILCFVLFAAVQKSTTQSTILVGWYQIMLLLFL